MLGGYANTVSVDDVHYAWGESSLVDEIGKSECGERGDF